MDEVKCLIALGSNVGDRSQHLDAAVNELADSARVTLLQQSGWIETSPVGGPIGQGAFFNGAVTLQTSLPPIELLNRLQGIEAALGRTRDVRWDARTMDLDLLLYGQQVIGADRLRTPHPRMTFRPFVLRPAVEIAGDWVHPELGATLAELLEQLTTGEDSLRIGGEAGQRAQMVEVLESIDAGFLPLKVSDNETWLHRRASEASSRKGDSPKLQVLVDKTAEAKPGTPCLRLYELPTQHWPMELEAAVRCVWKD